MNRTTQTILVVEDEPGVAELQRRRLERAGYRTATVDTAGAAWDQIRQGNIELLVLDQNLSATSTGLDFYADLKAAGYEIPVILVTGFSDEATAIRALRAGVRDFVTKSLEYLEYLPLAVERVLNQVRIERKLVESEACLREQAALLSKAQDAILVQDLDDRISFWNPSAERLYGWKSAEAIGRNALELLCEQTTPRLGDALVAVMEKGEWSGELRQVNKDGREIVVESRWTLVRDDAGRPKSKLVINTDVTEKKGFQAQLLHAQRMESVGTLAGGVAHEFNNLLQAIRGFTQFGMEGLAPADRRYQDLAQVVNAAERATTLTQQLLSFGRRKQLERTVVDPNQLVIELVKMIGPLIGERVEIQTDLGTDVTKIEVDAGQMHQALLNLCINARDAMPSGGRLLVTTGITLLSEEHCVVHGESTPGRYLMLSVADTGCGMAPDVKQRIFEPFFTTKEVGKGTGLGLAVTYGFVKQHGGTIQVDSEPGSGTTFTIYLPISDLCAEAEVVAPVDLPANGNELILVAEDDPVVRGFTVRVLSEAGYRTLAAADGQQALDSFEDQADAISLVILDVVMPKFGGHEVFDRMKGINPSVPVVFCSGYDPESTIDLNCNEFVRYIQKPFDPYVLLRVVRDLLETKLAHFSVIS